MRLKLALKGDLAAHWKAEYLKTEKAVTGAVKAAGDGLKRELRHQVTSAGLGTRLSKSWQSTIYPKGTVSAGAAALVFSKAPKLIRAFDSGATIRSSNGSWLAVPTKDAPKLGSDRKRINPSNFPEHVYGPLRFVYIKGRAGRLVVDDQRARKGKRGGYAKARSQKMLRTGEGLHTVTMFMLFKETKLKKRLDVDKAGRRWIGRVGQLIDREFSRLDALDKK